jgi:hypothetical protein
MYFFAGFFFESHPVYDQTQGAGAVFFLILWITLLPKKKILLFFGNLGDFFSEK